MNKLWIFIQTRSLENNNEKKQNLDRKLFHSNWKTISLDQ